MNPLKRIKNPQTQQMELARLGLLVPILYPEILSKFKQSFRNMFGRLYWSIKNNKLNAAQQIEKKVIEVLGIIKKNHSELTLSFLMKKLAYLFMFVNQSCYHKMLDQKLTLFFNNQISTIRKQISQMINYKKTHKKSSSLSKMYGFIKSISSSVDIQQKNKLKIQQLEDRVVVKQILKNCFQSYCNYIQKILQDTQSYKFIITKDSSYSLECLDWKIMNWANKLCDIIVDMNRLAKYFKEELMGVWVFIAYVISLDLSVYCDTLVNRIQKQSQKWVQKIMVIQKFMKQSRKKTIEQAQSVLKHPKFVQLRRQMEQLDKIRQKLNFLYRNPKIQNWMKQFVFPKPFTSQKYNQLNNEQCIKQFVSLCQKNENSLSLSPPKLKNKDKSISAFSFSQSINLSPNNAGQVIQASSKQNQPEIKNIGMIQTVQPANRQSKVQIAKSAVFALKRKSIMGNN